MKQRTEELLAAILEATEDATRGAKIDFDQKVQDALRRRGENLCEWFGFDSGQPLPAFDGRQAKTRKRKLSKNHRHMVARIRESEKDLQAALAARMDRLRERGNGLRRENRLRHSVGETVLRRTGKRLDRIG